MAPLPPLVENFSIITQFSFVLRHKKIAAPLSVCTEEEQRAVIRTLWSGGVPGAETHRRFSAQYGGSTLPRRSVYEWIEKFQHGWTSVKDEERAGCPFTSITDSNVEDARAMIQENRPSDY
jgi:hypothetical protein